MRHHSFEGNCGVFYSYQDDVTVLCGSFGDVTYPHTHILTMQESMEFVVGDDTFFGDLVEVVLAMSTVIGTWIDDNGLLLSSHPVSTGYC